MKLAFISDIHGNLQALNSGLQDIRRQGVDALLVLGDVATLGPNPREVIEVLAACEATFVRGNHDDLLIELHENSSETTAHEVYKWAAAQLGSSHVDFLKSFQALAQLKIDGFASANGILAYHASPWSNNLAMREQVATAAGRSALDDFAPDFGLFVGGHEHQQFRDTLGDRDCISVGSLGFPYKKVPFTGFPEANAWGEYAIVEYRAAQFKTDFRKFEYDKQAFHTAALQTDNPIRDWLLGVATNPNP